MSSESGLRSRSESGLTLNVHFQQLFIDGTYDLGDQGEPIDFCASDPPTLNELDQVLAKIIKRLTKYLERQKIIVKDEDNFQLSIPEEDAFSKAHELDRLEKICRYIARPAVAEVRLSTYVRGEVIYNLKKPWDDGTTAVKFTPMELMEKLADLVPRPRVRLTRFHGVLAPHYKPWGRLHKRVFNIDISICPKCQGRMRILAAIEDPKVIRKILDHLGIPSSPTKLGHLGAHQ